MYVYIYAHDIHIYIFICIYMHTYTHIRIHTHVFEHADVGSATQFWHPRIRRSSRKIDDGLRPRSKWLCRLYRICKCLSRKKEGEKEKQSLREYANINDDDVL